MINKIPLRLAMIGVGAWGGILLLEFYRLGAVTSFFCGSKLENQARVRKDYPDLHCASSYEEILRDPHIDGVIIATPAESHLNLASLALLAGKHVFLEKPMAMNLDQSRELANLAKKVERVLFVAHLQLYHPVYQKILELVKHDAPIFVRMSWDKFGTFKESILLNLAVHDLALSLDLFGEAKKVKILYKNGKISSCDIVVIQVDFERDRRCIIEINRISHVKRKTVSLFTKNAVYVWEGDKLFLLDSRQEKFEQIFEAQCSALEMECKAFLGSVQNQIEPKSSARRSLAVMEILESAREAI